jgi:hypothetical protein
VQSDLTAAYVRWTFLRAVLARGWWLTTALYLVIIADLSPFQLVLVGVFQGLTVIVCEVPAGVLADAVSRRRTLVIGHIVMGAGMAMAGLVTGFAPLVVSQCLWGLGWALSSGADVAWITDELDPTAPIERILVAAGRWQMLGTLVGILVFAALGWVTTLAVAMVAGGVAMAGLGAVVVARWPEARRAPVERGELLAASVDVARQGLTLARTDRLIGVVLLATLCLNGGAEGFGRLFERHLIRLGMPSAPDPIIWFAAVALVAAGIGATTLRYVEAWVEGAGVARRVYVTSCAVATVGLIVFAQAPNAASAVAGALLVSGIGLPTARVVSTILINRRATSDVRATVHSLLSQAENAGEIVFGLPLALTAAFTSPPIALTASAVMVAIGGIIAAGGARSWPERPTGATPAHMPDPRPLVLDDAIRDAIATAFPAHVVTVAYNGDDGWPRVTSRGTVQVTGDQQMALWARKRDEGMAASMADRPQLTLFYSDLAERGVLYTFFGIGRISDDPAETARVYEGSPEREQAGDPERRGVAIIVDLRRVVAMSRHPELNFVLENPTG